MHVFLDSSVLLAFCRSKRGASAALIDFAIRKKMTLYVSKKVIFEVANNNLNDNNEQGARRFEAVLQQKLLRVIDDCSDEELKKAIDVFHNEKDAPIIAAAKITSKITHILSLDNGFFAQEIVEYVKPKEILKPGDFLQKYRSILDG